MVKYSFVNEIIDCVDIKKGLQLNEETSVCMCVCVCFHSGASKGMKKTTKNIHEDAFHLLHL